ncbi:MAG TPA: hypothetical protein VGL57_15045 [Solirubrobacteraceae bacterium]
MNDLLNSLKSDLLDRRMLPILGLLALALAAAIAYAVLGGGAGSAPVAALPPVNHAADGKSLSVSQAQSNPNAAIAETTDGTRFQHQRGTRNPFTPLPSPKSSTTSSASTGASASLSKSSSATSTTSGSSTGSTPTGGSTGGATPTKPVEAPAPKQKKTEPVYLVDVLYGLAPTTPGQLSQLTPYAALKRLEPLPSASDPRIVFAGVGSSGKGAIFTNVGEAIIKGEGACMPSATQCEAVDLTVGETEEFEYIEGAGQAVTYELKIVSISKREASIARAARLGRRDRAGAALLRQLAPAVLDHLHFSSAKGVLLYAAHRHRR